MILAVAALVLTVALPVPADEHVEIETEWLTYTGTNLGIPTLVAGTLWVSPSTCDEAGVAGVKFCDALDPDLNNETERGYPDRVAINVRDDMGPRVGFAYQFVNATTGSILWSGFSCGHVNELVPHTDQGPEADPFFDQNATELRVFPDALESALLCGSPTISTGTVVVTWRYNATVFAGDLETLGGQ